jgi:AcrR family transcriptional regulator
MAEPHRRITDAAIELHGTVGPSRTTLSAVAKRAGVERRTLYRHFPTEIDLFAACSTHYLTTNPWPDPGTWRAIGDPQQRLERSDAVKLIAALVEVAATPRHAASKL